MHKPQSQLSEAEIEQPQDMTGATLDSVGCKGVRGLILAGLAR